MAQNYELEQDINQKFENEISCLLVSIDSVLP